MKSVFIASISHIINNSGDREIHSTPTWPLIHFFKKRCKVLVVVELPLPRENIFFQPQAVLYKNGVFKGKNVVPKIFSLPFRINRERIKQKTYFRLKMRDTITIIWFLLRYRQRYELFIGIESLSAIIGGILKKLGIFKKTVYYISDWSPKKYKNIFLNWLYIKMDWWACKWSDFIWNYTYTISEARRNILKYRMDKIGHELCVPFGFIPNGVIIQDYKDVDRRRLVYCGGIGHDYGVDLIIEALPLIRRKFPDIKIDILGTGPDMGILKNRAEVLGVNDCIVWHGYVSDRKEILSYYLKASIALAPYSPVKDSVKRYGDVIKIREAIGCGLPIITTTVPPSHKEVLEKGLGEVIEYTPQSLTDAVIKLLDNERYYLSVREKVINASRENLWENIYTSTLTAMGYKDTSKRTL